MEMLIRLMPVIYSAYVSVRLHVYNPLIKCSQFLCLVLLTGYRVIVTYVHHAFVIWQNTKILS
jgi:hypothetical protein